MRFATLRAAAFACSALLLTSCGGGSAGGDGNGGGTPGTAGPAGRGPAPQPTGAGVTLYVSRAGRDSNDCSQGAPCLTIQRAADLATVAGSVVLVADGEYEGFCSVHGGVTFFGNGDHVLVSSEATGASCEQDLDDINVEGEDDVVVAGFTVRGAARYGIRVVDADRVTVRNNRVESNGVSGILTGFAVAVRVLDNETADNGEHGIYVSNSDSADDRPVIRGNVSHGNTSNGIQINGDCFTGDGSQDGTISDAVVDGNHVHGNGAKGLSMISAPGVTISNNVIENNHQRGLGAGGVHLVNEPGCDASQSTIGAVVVNNTVVEPAMAAIRVNDDAVGAVIFNNILVSGTPIALENGVAAFVSTTNLQVGSTNGLFGDGFELAPDSPARDAGEAAFHGKPAPGSDITGAARPRGAGYDAGAYESF